MPLPGRLNLSGGQSGVALRLDMLGTEPREHRVVEYGGVERIPGWRVAGLGWVVETPHAVRRQRSKVAPAVP
jgi:hypothetical protein